MMLHSLFFSTLFASLCTLSAAAADLAANTPSPNPVQCANTTLSWSGGEAPFNVYVFSGCNDSNDSPLATFTDVTGNSVVWYVTVGSGDGFFFQVEDSTADVYSDDIWVGGDAYWKGACEAKVSSMSTQSVATATTTSSNQVPTTMAGGNDGSYGAGGVANAVDGPSSTHSIPASTGTDAPATNGASSLLARPLEIGVGLLAVSIAAWI